MVRVGVKGKDLGLVAVLLTLPMPTILAASNRVSDLNISMLNSLTVPVSLSLWVEGVHW